MDNRLFSGKYAIQGEIARGGMGIIYKAMHTTLNRTVAIKVLNPQYTGDSAFLKRFQREARAMARLDHENIIRVFDVAEEQGSHYIVMEFFGGKDLKQIILERGRFLPEETLSIATQIASALAYAHAQGIVHRDIKPGNIMVDSTGRVKIADFGIAAATDEISVTATGQIIGTPEYMSPEQARGEHLDGRTDLYSLGMVIYEMVNGQTPFQGISRMAIVGKLLYEQEEYNLSFPQDVPFPVQDFIRSLLKKQPQNRISDAHTLIARIKSLGVKFKETSRPEPARHPTGPQHAPLSQEEEGPTVMLKEATSGTLSPAEAVGVGTPSYQTPLSRPISRPATGAVSARKPSAASAPLQQPAKLNIKTRGFIPLLAGAAGVIVLLGGLLYYLSTIGENSSPPPVTDRKPEAGALSLTGVREIQISIREIQDRLTTAQSEADAADARKWAPEVYQQAVDNETKGSQALQEGDNLINQRQYEGAKTSLQQALAHLSQAHEGFVQARKTAVSKIAEEEKARAERERLEKKQAEQEKLKKAKEERLAKARAEAEAKKPQSTQQAQEVPKEVAAKKPAVPAARPDIELVGEILSNFKRAYESRNIQALRQISLMSEDRDRFLQQIFRDYSSVNLTITDLSLTSETASAVVVIIRLTDQKGNQVIPGNEWKKAKVVIKKQANQWGRVIW